MDTLNLDKVTKDYGKFRALDNVSLQVEPGMFGLLGPNGAGKTTLMRILTTLITCTSGNIRYGQLDWTEPNDIRNIIGYLPQKFSMYKQIKVREALLHIANLKGIRSEREKKVDEILDKVNLVEQKDKKISQLSGGMIRRVGIAQALLGNPKIIIVDEPTAGLDPEERIRFRKLLRQLGKDSIVIISTHIVEDIESTCDRAAILYKGKLLAEGAVNHLGGIAKGYIWEKEVDKEDYYALSESLNIISNHQKGDKYRLRILSEKHIEGGQLVEPTLEDGYLLLMKRESA